MSQGTTISAKGEPPSPRIAMHGCPPQASFRVPAIMSVCLAILFTWVFWDFLYRQVRFATTLVADWGHTLVIPFIAGYFIYIRRHELMSRPFKTTWIAMVPILLGVAWYMLCVFGPQPLWHHNLRGIGFATTLFGVTLLFVGWRAMVVLAFPLFYLIIFGQTISDRLMEIVTFKLQDITARGSEIVLRILSFEVTREGNTLYLWEVDKEKPMPLNIAEACSGMRMLMAFLALGVAMAYTMLRRHWQRAVLVLLALPTAIFVNVMRVVTLGLLGRVDVNFTGGEFHTFIGLVWLVPAFLIYLALVWIILHIVVEKPRVATATHSDATGPSQRENPRIVMREHPNGGGVDNKGG